MKIETGNQQVTLRDIGWLAGIIDGDGTLVLATSKRKSGNETHQPFLRVINTSPQIIEKVVKILDSLEIACFVMEPTMVGRLGKKPVINVTVQRIAELKKLLDIITEDLTAKQARAKLLLRYCNLRLEHGLKRRYTDEVREIASYWKENIISR